MKKKLLSSAKTRLLLGVASLLGATAALDSGALAASPMYVWSGCYIGANAGYSWGRASIDGTASGLGTFGASPFFGQDLNNMNGFIGGGQVGCNWQTGNGVLGLETDFQGSGQKAHRNSNTSFNDGEGGAGNLSQAIEARLRWFGTARARAGVLVVPTVLLYGTAGLAYGNVKVTDTMTATVLGTTTSTTFSASSTRAGFAAGFGAEGAIPNAPMWTWRLEYLYIDLGSFRGTATDPLGGVVAWNAKVTDNIVRAGFNYKFSAAP